MRFNKDSTLTKFLGSLLVALLIFYVFYSILKNIHILKSYHWQVNFFLLVSGIFILLISNSVATLVWKGIVQSLGRNLTYSESFYVWILSRLGRYIPGKVWMIAGRVALTQKVDKKVILLSVGIEILLDILAAITLAILTFPVLRIRDGIITPPPWTVPILLITIFVFLNPKSVRWFITKYTSLEPSEVAFNIIQLGKFYLVLLGLWVLRMGGHWFVIKGFGISLGYLKLVGAFSLSWIIGLFSPFAPGGLGVREGLITFLLANVTTPGISGIVALATRMSSTIQDLLLGVPAWFLYTKRK